MKTAKQSLPDKDDETFIDLERVPVENIAEVTETLDRVRRISQRLIGQIKQAADKLERGEPTHRGKYDTVDFEHDSERIGKGLIALERAMKIVINSAAAKQKLNGKK